MNLPQYFQFSQGNLQDFNDCRRRFYLRHVQQLAWPAVKSEPFIENERFMQQGTAFHRMAQQYFLGIPAGDLSKLASTPPVDTWWQNFTRHVPQMPGIAIHGARFFPEFSLTGSIANHRVVAKFDLIVALPDDKLIIYDWKTSHGRPRRTWLAQRTQTRLYRYLLLVAGRQLLDTPLIAENITMVYWFAGFPEQPEVFLYDANSAAQDSSEYQQLLRTIESLVEEDHPKEPGIGFPLTSNEKHCTFCQYRSLCNRGVRAGTITSTDEYIFEDESGLTHIELDFEQIAEIEF
jgi:hypothetical protein